MRVFNWLFLSFLFIGQTFSDNLTSSASLAIGYRYDSLLCRLKMDQTTYDQLNEQGPSYFQSIDIEGKVEGRFYNIDCAIMGGVAPIISQDLSSIAFYGANPETKFYSLTKPTGPSGVIYHAAVELQLPVVNCQHYLFFIEAGWSLEGITHQTKKENLLLAGGNSIIPAEVVKFQRSENIGWTGPSLGVKNLFHHSLWSINLDAGINLPLFFGSKKATIQQLFRDQFHDEIHYTLNIKPRFSWGYYLKGSFFYQIYDCCFLGAQMFGQSLIQQTSQAHSSQILKFFSPTDLLLGESEHLKIGNFQLHWTHIQAQLCFLVVF